MNTHRNELWYIVERLYLDAVRVKSWNERKSPAWNNTQHREIFPSDEVSGAIYRAAHSSSWGVFTSHYESAVDEICGTTNFSFSERLRSPYLQAMDATNFSLYLYQNSFSQQKRVLISNRLRKPIKELVFNSAGWREGMEGTKDALAIAELVALALAFESVPEAFSKMRSGTRTRLITWSREREVVVPSLMRDIWGTPPFWATKPLFYGIPPELTRVVADYYREPRGRTRPAQGAAIRAPLCQRLIAKVMENPPFADPSLSDNPYIEALRTFISYATGK
jgi:hypothetical protein